MSGSVAIDRTAGVLGLDPRTHLFAPLIVGAAAMLMTGLVETACLQLVAAGSLCLNGEARLAGRICVFFAVVTALSFVPLAGLYGVFFVTMMHMAPPFTVACAFFILSPSAIMGALSRWKVPGIALVGICLGFRFVSVLAGEAKLIVRGIRMRGIFPHAFDAVRHSALVYECLYTPLVMRCLRLSAELAASSELRGIEIEGTRTTLHHVGFSVRDAGYLVILALASASLLWAGDIL